MITFNQLIRSARKKKKKLTKSKQLDECPHKKGICLRVYVAKPKKPNSAIRKVARVKLTGTDKTLIVYIPGHGHNLKQFSAVMIRGGRVKDLPGVHYHAVRGKYDFSSKENINRNRARSKYGLNRLKL